MLRSLKARIELDAQEAIARLEQLGINMDQAKAQLERGQVAARRFGGEAETASRRAQQGFQKTQQATLSGVQALEQYRLRLLAIGAAGTAAVGFMVKAAMDVETNLATLGALFGDQAQAALGWAKTWGAAYGYAVSTLTPLMSSLQGMLLSIGFNSEQAAEYGRTLIQLAADMGAVAGVPLPEALDAVTRAMAGQTRGLINMGILVRQDQLDNEARRMGYKKAYNDLTEQQKALVAMSAIQRAAAHTTGYLAEHMDLASVQTRRLREALGDLREELGEPWRRVWGSAAGRLADIVNGFKDNKPLMTFISVLFGVGSAALGALGQLGMLIWALHQIQRTSLGAGMVRAFTAPFRLLRGAAETAYLKLLFLKDGLLGVGRAALMAARNVVRAGAQMVVAAVRSAAAWVKSRAIKAAAWTAEKIQLALVTIHNWLYAASVEGGFLANVKAKAAALAHAVALGVKTVALKLAAGAQWALNVAMYANPAFVLVAKFVLIAAAVAGLAYGIYRLVQHFGGLRAVMNGIAGFFVKLWEKMKAFGATLASFGRSIAGFFRGVWDGIVAGFREAWNFVLRMVNNGTRRFLAILNSALGWVPWLGKKIKGAIQDFDPLMPLIWEMRKGRPELAAEVERIANIVRHANPGLHGQDLMTAFVKEIADSAPHLKDAVLEFAAPLRSHLEAKSPPKEGPLRKIRQWGRGLGTEYARGVEEAQIRIFRALPRKLAPFMSATADGGHAEPISLEETAARLREAANLFASAVPAGLSLTMPEGALAGLPGGGAPPTVGSAWSLLAGPRGGAEQTPAAALRETLVRQNERLITRLGPRAAVTVNLGGLTINMREGASRSDARALGTEAATVLTGRMKEELARYLLETLGAEEALRMPDEVE